AILYRLLLAKILRASWYGSGSSCGSFSMINFAFNLSNLSSGSIKAYVTLYDQIGNVTWNNDAAPYTVAPKNTAYQILTPADVNLSGQSKYGFGVISFSEGSGLVAFGRIIYNAGKSDEEAVPVTINGGLPF
ncbi:MAG: hypothetical protein AAF485_32530, partial [Chloroflexota bacterium]